MKIIKDGILTQNPTFIQLVGMCPVLAVSTSVENGIGMGLAATAVLICSNAVISALRKAIPNKIRIAIFVVIIASFVTMVDLMMQAFLPSLSKSLGVFVPLIVVNCIIIARAESFAIKRNVLESALDGLSMGLGFTGALIILSSVREILGNGTWFGIQLFGDAFQPFILFILPAGGFLALGIIIAVLQYITNKSKEKGANAK